MSVYVCESCNLSTSLDVGYDSYICSLCNKWIEKQCSDDECEYCVGRPDNPIREDIHLMFVEVYEELGETGLRSMEKEFFRLKYEEGYGYE